MSSYVYFLFLFQLSSYTASLLEMRVKEGCVSPVSLLLPFWHSLFGVISLESMMKRHLHLGVFEI